MFKVQTDSYAEMLEIHYRTKVPLFVYGGPGIGKSAIPRQVAIKLAAEKGRQFKEWNDMTVEDKADAMANPQKWFIMTDFRLGQCDSSDLRGIPRLEGEFMSYSPMPWVGYYSKPDADGMIFFDELNLAAPIVAGQAYQIINDRIISDIRVSPNVFIFAAGNRASDKAQVFSMSFPLKDRFSEIELGINDETWCQYAMESKINPHLVAFVKWKPSVLYKPPMNNEDKGSTPRGIFRTSKLIEGIDIESPLCHTLVSSAVGEAFATEFAAYVAVASAIDFEFLLKNPKKAKELLTSPDKKFAICGLLGEHVRKTKDNDKDRFSAMFALVHNLPTEYGVVALNMLRTSMENNAKFKRAITYYPDHKELFKSAAKFAL